MPHSNSIQPVQSNSNALLPYLWGGEYDPYADKKQEELKAKLDAARMAREQEKYRANMSYLHFKVGFEFEISDKLEELARRVEPFDFSTNFDRIYFGFSNDFHSYLFSLWLTLLKSKGYEEGHKILVKKKLPLLSGIVDKYRFDLHAIDRMHLRLSMLISSRSADLSCDYQSEKLFEDFKTKNKGMNIVNLSVEDIERYAENLVRVFKLFEMVYQHSDMLLDEHYRNLAVFTRTIGLSLPYQEMLEQGDEGEFSSSKALSDIKRTQNERFWRNRLIKFKRRGYENLSAGCKQIGRKKHQTSYVSYGNLSFFVQQQIKNQEFLEKSRVVNAAEGVSLSLVDVFNSSVSNPKNRATELRIRAKGAEMMANELGYEALFITATVPSRFHPNSDSYDGSSVRDGLEWFLARWRVARATLSKNEVKYFGIRCSEPHNDSTMHGHFVIFVHPADKKYLIEIMRDAWVKCEPDSDKGKNWENGRFNYKELDPSKGSAVSYITKYVAKNVYSEDELLKSDEDDRLSLKDNVVNVKAWASLWSIRQFQFFGLPSVTVYRELRRAKNRQRNVECAFTFVRPKTVLPVEFRGVAHACDVGDFYQYIKDQTPTEDDKVIWDSEDDGDKKARFKWVYSPMSENRPNQYDEDVPRVIGVWSRRTGNSVVSKPDLWIVEKGHWDGEAKFDLDCGSAVGGGEAAASWNTGNNCNSEGCSFFEHFYEQDDFWNDDPNDVFEFG